MYVVLFCILYLADVELVSINTPGLTFVNHIQVCDYLCDVTFLVRLYCYELIC